MGLFSKVLLTVDFDRTITAPDSSIPEANLAAIRYFMAEDGAFTVNTGRSVPMFAPYLNAIPHNAPWLLYNGSAAYDGEQLSQLREIPLDRGAFFQALRRKFPELNIEEQGIGGHYTYWDNPVFQEFYRQVGAAHRQMVLEENREPFLKVSLFGSPRAYCVADLFDATARRRRPTSPRPWSGSRRPMGTKLRCSGQPPGLLTSTPRGCPKSPLPGSCKKIWAGKFWCAWGMRKTIFPCSRGRITPSVLPMAWLPTGSPMCVPAGKGRWLR